MPAELRSSKNGLIKTKNEDQKCFLWGHVRHVNPVKIHPERITREDKKLAKELGYNEIEFHVQEKDFSKIETRNSISISVFGYENGLTFPICIKEKKLENVIDLLLVFDDDKSHYVYVKDLDRYMFHKTKNKNKKPFCKSCLQCFSGKNVLTKHKKHCLGINDLQSVKLGKGTIEFKNYSKFVDFESNLESAEIYEGSCTKKYQSHNSCNFAYKVVCIDDRFGCF